MARKKKDEDALRKSIAANPERQKMYGDAWDAIAKAHKAYPTYIRERRIFDQGAGFNSTYFTFARGLVRLATENEKPNAERLPGVHRRSSCVARVGALFTGSDSR